MHFYLPIPCYMMAENFPPRRSESDVYSQHNKHEARQEGNSLKDQDSYQDDNISFENADCSFY